MWTTQQPKFKDVNGTNHLVELTHNFGNEVTVVTNFETRTSKTMHGKIEVSENELISDTEKYLMFLSNIDNEVNPVKNEN